MFTVTEAEGAVVKVPMRVMPESNATVGMLWAETLLTSIANERTSIRTSRCVRDVLEAILCDNKDPNTNRERIF